MIALAKRPQVPLNVSGGWVLSEGEIGGDGNGWSAILRQVSPGEKVEVPPEHHIEDCMNCQEPQTDPRPVYNFMEFAGVFNASPASLQRQQEAPL
jgi:hypothetical protein